MTGLTPAWTRWDCRHQHRVSVALQTRPHNTLSASVRCTVVKETWWCWTLQHATGCTACSVTSKNNPSIKRKKKKLNARGRNSNRKYLANPQCLAWRVWHNPWTMTTYYIQRPSVPSSSGVPTQGSGNDDDGAEGAKNRWVLTGCHWKLKICTCNARSLSSDDRVIEFEDEIARIKFDIIGISETRRKGEGCLTLNTSCHTFYYKGGDTCHRGVGFMVNKNIAGNVTSFKSVSNRLAQLTIRINDKYILNIIQVYLPTSSHEDQEVESVYGDIDTTRMDKTAGTT